MEQKDIEKAASKHSASLWDKNIIDCSSDFDFVYDFFCCRCRMAHQLGMAQTM